MRWVLNILLALVVVSAAGFAFQWLTVERHADPATAASPATPNWVIAAPRGADLASEAAIEAPVWAVDPATLLRSLDEVALAEPRTEVVAAPSGAFGDGEPLAKTYLQRTATVGYPDYVSVRSVAGPAGPSSASLQMFSRSVFGISDRGFNRARVERWIAELDKRHPRVQ